MSKTKPIKLTKERNPFVQHAMFRKAGSHQKSKKAIRKLEKQRFQKESKEFFQAA